MLKKVGSSGQLSLGKKYAGCYFQVEQQADGAVVLLPRTASWDSLRAALAMFEPGLRLEREQPARAECRHALRR